jgi:ClpP class serine protease
MDRFPTAGARSKGGGTIVYASRPFGLIFQDDVQGFMATQHRLSSKNLDLILHSSGGSSEAAEQIVGYLRSR